MALPRVERIIGTDKFRVTIDGVQHTLSLPAFNALAQSVLDTLQAIVATQSKPK